VPAEPSSDVLFFDGTARVLRVGPDGKRCSEKDPDKGELRAGADLYARLRYDPDLSQKNSSGLAYRDPSRWDTGPDGDGKTIPIFPRALYRYYLEITKTLENVPADGDISISFSIHEFKQDIEWPNPGNRWVCLKWMPAFDPNKYQEYFEGNVIDQDSGQIVGTVTMCRVSQNVRSATVAIHRMAGVEFYPGDNVPGMGGAQAKDAWSEAFKETGWAITLDPQPKPLLKPVDGRGIWTIGELQQALYAIRIRSMVNAYGVPADIKKAAKAVDTSLEKMTQLQIQQSIPGLATLPDPLDHQWLYQLLCVPKIDGFDRGVMFDPYGSDSGNLPREGAAVAAEWIFGEDADNLIKNNRLDKNTQAPEEIKEQADEIRRKWGVAINLQLQKVAEAYFRVGVHEIGHSMGLDHNFKDAGFMNTTDSIADEELSAQKKAFATNLKVSQLANLPTEQKQLREDAIKLGVPAASDITPAKPITPEISVPAEPSSPNTSAALGYVTSTTSVKFTNIPSFPKFIKPRFQADDLNRLRFGPDVTIRPGTSFHDFGPMFADVEPAPADGLRLEVAPLLDAVPIGAPARIKLRITNTSCEPQYIPRSLGLSTGMVTGSVVDPQGNERNFWPLKQGEDSDPGSLLAPYETKTYAMTLLRGPQKALFAMAGDHRVKVTVSWRRKGIPVSLAHEATVRVTTAVDDNHRAAALKVISTPDALFSIAVIGDHLTEGNAAVETAVNNPILGPHFAVIRAKLLLKGPHKPDPALACDLIQDRVVMSFDEIDSITGLLEVRFGEDSGLGAAKLHEAASCQPGSDPYRIKFRAAVSCLQSKIRILRAEGSIEADRAQRTAKKLEELLKLWP
jgi:hypothetical protein